MLCPGSRRDFQRYEPDGVAERRRECRRGRQECLLHETSTTLRCRRAGLPRSGLRYYLDMRFLIIPALSVCFFLAAAGHKPAGPVQFKTHVIEDNMPGGYTVIIADINNDHRPDVIGMTQRINELAWYENPDWDRHVMLTAMPSMVNT